MIEFFKFGTPYFPKIKKWTLTWIYCCITFPMLFDWKLDVLCVFMNFSIQKIIKFGTPYFSEIETNLTEMKLYFSKIFPMLFYIKFDILYFSNIFLIPEFIKFGTPYFQKLEIWTLIWIYYFIAFLTLFDWKLGVFCVFMNFSI